jgi:hypothetical protein
MHRPKSGDIGYGDATNPRPYGQRLTLVSDASCEQPGGRSVVRRVLRFGTAIASRACFGLAERLGERHSGSGTSLRKLGPKLTELGIGSGLGL